MNGPKVGEIVASIYNPDFTYRVLNIDTEKGRVDLEIVGNTPPNWVPGVDPTRYNGVAIENLKSIERG